MSSNDIQIGYNRYASSYAGGVKPTHYKNNKYNKSNSSNNSNNPLVAKFAQDVKNGNITFPYQRDRITDDEIREMFDKLQKFKSDERWRYSQYQLRNIVIDTERLVFKGRPTLLIVKGSDYAAWERLSDMWNEECRMKCLVYDQKLTPFDFFMNHPDRIATHALRKNGEITPYTTREAIYELARECTSHKPTHIMALMKLFDAKTILDFSSGWGDRCIGAMAGGADFYCGVDPNPCLHPNYNAMIDFFKWGDRVQMIESTIEDAELPDRKFDLVFTSPPYFDLEIYDTGDDDNAKAKQSINYGGQRDWFDKFLVVAIDKVWAKLKDGGVLAVNINQKNKKENYIDWMIQYMKTLPNANYLGVISYANEKVSNPQPIWICQKQPFRVENGNVYLRHFTPDDIPRMSEIMGNTANMHTIATGETKTPEQVDAQIRKYIALEYTFYPIVLKTNDTIVGYIGHYSGRYTDRSLADKRITRIVIDEPHRGKGYAQSAYRALQQTTDNILFAMIEPNNTASVRAHEKAGFTHDSDISFKNHNYKLYRSAISGSDDTPTYIIRTYEFDQNYVEELFNERGWKPAPPMTVPSLVYEDSDNMVAKNTFAGEAIIKTVLGESRKAIVDKARLYHGANKQYMPTQFDIRPNPRPEFIERFAKKIFADAPQWIVRPVGGWFFKGRGISTVTNYAELKKAIAPRTQYAVSVYINNPLLWKHQYKFHIRDIVIYGSDTQYIHDPELMYAYPAKEPYHNADFNNKDIHDTHFVSLDYTGYLKDIKVCLGKHYDAVRKQMEEIVKTTLESFTPEVYEETTHGIGIFGYDVMIDCNYRVWLLEVNDKIGLAGISPRPFICHIMDTAERLLKAPPLNNKSKVKNMSRNNSKVNKNSKYTFIVRSRNFSMHAVSNVLNPRGWFAYNKNTAGIPTLLYEDESFMYGKNTHKGKVVVKSILNNNKSAITDKANLYTTLMDAYPGNTFMLPQYTLQPNNSVSELSDIFDQAPVWIVKPVGKGFYKGKGISVVKNMAELKGAIAKDTKYAVAQYLTNPLLYDGKKFHIRVLVICGSDSKFIVMDKLNEIYPAEDVWEEDNYTNSRVHDTHFVSHEYTGSMRDLEKRFGEDKTAEISQQMSNIINATICSFKPEPYPESQYGFEIFGYDFIVNDDFHVYLMEVNAKVGLEGYDPKIVFDAIADTAERVMGD